MIPTESRRNPALGSNKEGILVMACKVKFEDDLVKIREPINLVSDCFIPIIKAGSLLSVCGVLGIGRTKAGEIIKEPDFPQPVDLGGRCIRYRLSEVISWAEGKRASAAPSDESMAAA